MKYKVGDKVRIKSLEWYNSANKDEFGTIRNDESYYIFLESMVQYVGKEATITKNNASYYSIDIDDGKFAWNDWMFEENISENGTDYDYEQLKEIAIELIRADVSPREVAFWAKEMYKELKKK